MDSDELFDLYDKECGGKLTREECFFMYFPCGDFDCKFYGDCKDIYNGKLVGSNED